MRLCVKLTALLAVGLLSCCGGADGLAVMSVDLGSEWMKIGIVSVRDFILYIRRSCWKLELRFLRGYYL
jgi:hypothetical protein